MFNIFKTEKLPRGIRKLLIPSGKFRDQTKLAFMTMFDAAHPDARVAHGFTAAVKTLIASGALVAIFAGVTVYADTANVPADSSLYPLKRLGENVQLALAPVTEKPELQATFAARRVTEITDLTKTNPSSTIITGLDKDLDTDVDDSISAAAAADLGDGKLNMFCNKVLSVVTSSSVAVNNESLINGRTLVRFEKQCGSTLNGSSTQNVSTTFTIPPWFASMPTSTVASGTFPRGGNRGHRIDLPFGNGTSTSHGFGGNSNTSTTASSTYPFRDLRGHLTSHLPIVHSATSTVSIVASTTISTTTINSEVALSSTVEASTSLPAYLKSLFYR